MPVNENMNTEIYYHGSKAMFERFDLAHALEGDGRVKFGFGIYVTVKSDTKKCGHISFS